MWNRSAETQWISGPQQVRLYTTRHRRFRTRPRAPECDATVSCPPDDHGSQVIRLSRAFAEFQDVLINRLYEVLA